MNETVAPNEAIDPKKREFLAAIAENPDYTNAIAVYADWLREDGRTPFEQAHGEMIWRTLHGEIHYPEEWFVASLLPSDWGAKEWSSLRIDWKPKANYTEVELIERGQTALGFHVKHGLVFNVYLRSENWREHLKLTPRNLMQHHPVSVVNFLTERWSYTPTIGDWEWQSNLSNTPLGRLLAKY
jgi:uncharacterized protein (TIGR02996 family)